MSCGVGRRRDLDPTGLWLWLWLWRRPEATAPIRPLAWEPPHAAGLALKSQKDQKQTNKHDVTKRNPSHVSVVRSRLWHIQ